MKAEEAWNAAYHQLELQFDRASFDTWLRRTSFLGYDEGVFVIGVQNGYVLDMLQHRLYRNVRRVLSDVWGDEVELRFEICKEEPVRAPSLEDRPLFRFMAQQENDSSASPLHHLLRSPEQNALPDSDLNPHFTFERFIMNESNRMVYEAACAVAQHPATVYNPFLVYGGVGLGKTHILQSIAHVCSSRGLRTIYVSSEAFTNDLIHAIRNRTTAMFREKYRAVDVLLVDDIQFIGGKDTTQEEFFHTFNTLVNFNKQIVLASDRHPRELATLEDRLRSRFQGGLVADIQPPELETRIAILEMWAGERGIQLGYHVIEMMAQRAARNIRDLHGVFNQVVAQAQTTGRQSLTRHQAEDTLERYTRPMDHLTLHSVAEATAAHFGLKVQDLIGPRRSGKINTARQIAMFLARELTDASLPQIGDFFGGRSHTTVLHGCNKVSEEIEFDPILSTLVEKIRHRIAPGV